VTGPVALPRAFAYRLALARAEQGLTLKDVADQVGVSGRSVVSGWENGHISPRLGHLIAWARLLGFELAMTGPGEHCQCSGAGERLEAVLRALEAERASTGRREPGVEELMQRLIHTIHQAFKTPPDRKIGETSE
jgi:transcriptional regulator with XRE-family HTH domain